MRGGGQSEKGREGKAGGKSGPDMTWNRSKAL